MSDCDIQGCVGKRYVRGWCVMHYNHWRKRGTPGAAERERAPWGAGHVDTSNGYRVITRADHPTSNGQGHAYEHRVALYDAIGPGHHPCHWCRRDVVWFGDPRLVVDHLDGDKLNNRTTNLVPSCIPCNAERGR